MKGNTTIFGSNVTVNITLVMSLSVAMSVINVFGNTMTIIAICKREILRTTPNKFIVNLAVSDLILAFRIVLEVFIYLGQANSMVCLFTAVFWNISCLMSIASLVLIAVDRFAYIFRPLHYHLIMTTTRTNALIAASWIIAIIMVSADFVWRFWFQNAPLCHLIIPLWFKILVFITFMLLNAMLLILYGWLFSIARTQRKRVADTINGTNAAMLTSNYKILKVIFIVVGFTEACWIPFLAVLAFNISGDSLWSPTIFVYMGLAFYLNSALNFFIYAARDKAFYTAYKSLLCFNC